MSSTINALRPAQNPATRFGQPGPNVLTGPRLPANALAVPPPLPAAPAAAVAPPAPMPEPPALTPQDLEGRVSARVPVPTADFHPREHEDLHGAMGEAFDRPGASRFVRDVYDAVRQQHPHVEPRAALLTARDAWHAVQHGFLPQHMAQQAVLDHHARGARP